MRRILAFSALVATLATLAPASAQDRVHATAGAGQFAWADWVSMNGDRGFWYVAFAARQVTSEGMESFGVVARGPCRARHNGRSITCWASGRVKSLGFDQFQMDPLLRTASLRMRSHGHLHEVDWAATNDPPNAAPDWHGVLTPWWVEAWGGLGAYQGATVGGRAYDRRVTPDDQGFTWAFLGEGAGLWAYAQDAGEPVRFSRTFRVAG